MGPIHRKDQNSIPSIFEKSTDYSGILPDPTILARYNKIVPGSAERIIAMAERQARHRQTLEISVIRSNMVNEKSGILFAFIITMIAMIWGAFLLFIGKDMVGTIAFFGPLLFHATNYVIKKIEQYREM